MGAIGPSLPPHLANKRKRSDSESSDEGLLPAPAKRSRSSSPRNSPRPRVIGPGLPPGDNSADRASASADAPRRTLGPSLPPAAEDVAAHSPSLDADQDESSDDDYGPALPPPAGASARPVANVSSARTSNVMEQAAPPSKPQREEWMLAPPSGADWASRIDPSQMKARKFKTGKGAKASSTKGGISDLWTETPEEKRQRLEGEVLGNSESKDDTRTKEDAARAQAVRRRREEEDRETKRRVDEYDAARRGKDSLVDKHKSKHGSDAKEDDPSKRVFDYEKDIAGGSLSGQQQRKMLSQAKGMGNRFEKGRFL